MTRASRVNPTQRARELRVTDGRDRTATDPVAPLVRDAVRSVRSGDREAFGRIVELYQRRLFGLALMMTRDPSGAEEIAQDAFVRAFVNLDGYDEARRSIHGSRPLQSGWRRTGWCAARECIPAKVRSSTSDRPVPAEGADPLTELIADESDRGVWLSVAALPSGERTAAILYYRQDMSVREIAGALGVTSGTIKTLLFRARARLRRAMADTHLTRKQP